MSAPTWQPLATPRRDLRVRYRTGPWIYSVYRYGRICDQTPDGQWIKVKPSHPHHHRRWLPRDWVWEQTKDEV